MSRIAAALWWLGVMAGAPDQDAVGTWGLDVAFPQRAATVELVVGPDSTGTLTAVWRGPQGELRARELHAEPGRLTFVLVAENQRGDPIRMEFRGEIDGDALTGALTIGTAFEARVSGTRKR